MVERVPSNTMIPTIVFQFLAVSSLFQGVAPLETHSCEFLVCVMGHGKEELAQSIVQRFQETFSGPVSTAWVTLFSVLISRLVS